jgi:hypothetical protein
LTPHAKASAVPPALPGLSVLSLRWAGTWPYPQYGGCGAA